MQKSDNWDQYQMTITQKYKGDISQIEKFFQNNLIQVDKVSDSGTDAKSQFSFSVKSSDHKKISELEKTTLFNNSKFEIQQKVDWNKIEDSDGSDSEKEREKESPNLFKGSQFNEIERRPQQNYTKQNRVFKIYPKELTEIKKIVELNGRNMFYNFTLFNIEYSVTPEELNEEISRTTSHHFNFKPLILGENQLKGQFVATLDNKSALQLIERFQSGPLIMQDREVKLELKKANFDRKLRNILLNRINKENQPSYQLVASNITEQNLTEFYKDVQFEDIKESGDSVSFSVDKDGARFIFQNEFPEENFICSNINLKDDRSEQPYYQKQRFNKGYQENKGRDRSQEIKSNRRHHSPYEQRPVQNPDLNLGQTAQIEMNEKRKQKITTRYDDRQNNNQSKKFNILSKGGRVENQYEIKRAVQKVEVPAQNEQEVESPCSPDIINLKRWESEPAKKFQESPLKKEIKKDSLEVNDTTNNILSANQVKSQKDDQYVPKTSERKQKQYQLKEKREEYKAVNAETNQPSDQKFSTQQPRGINHKSRGKEEYEKIYVPVEKKVTQQPKSDQTGLINRDESQKYNSKKQKKQRRKNDNFRDSRSNSSDKMGENYNQHVPKRKHQYSEDRDYVEKVSPYVVKSQITTNENNERMDQKSEGYNRRGNRTNENKGEKTQKVRKNDDRVNEKHNQKVSQSELERQKMIAASLLEHKNDKKHQEPSNQQSNQSRTTNTFELLF